MIWRFEVCESQPFSNVRELETQALNFEASPGFLDFIYTNLIANQSLSLHYGLCFPHKRVCISNDQNFMILLFAKFFLSTNDNLLSSSTSLIRKTF